MSNTAESVVSGTTFPNPAPDAVDESPVPLRLLRDVAIGVLLFFAWTAVEGWAFGTGSFLRTTLSVLAGIVVGFTIYALTHEWGHFAGARLSGGHAPTTSLRTHYPVFTFDTARSTPRQFLAMSLGARLELVPLALWFWLYPDATPGQLAVQAAALAGTVLGLWTDTPIILRLLGGASIDDAWRPHQDHLARNRGIAALLALAAALLLVLSR